MSRLIHIGIAILACLSLASIAAAQTPANQAKSQASKPSQQSLGDLARKLRPKDAEITSKRVWTNDDFHSSGDEANGPEVAKQTSPESAEQALEEFRSLDQQEIGRAVLKEANAPDVNFADRRGWEERLFHAKQDWLGQVDRMAGHKDSNKDVQNEELRLAQGAQKKFWQIAQEGIENARAVDDPIVKAHLEYKRRLDSCQAMSGDLWETCEQSAEAFKAKMQRDGSW